MRKFRKTFIALAAAVMLVVGSNSALASNQHIQWETEPNDTFATASQAISYNISQAINRGFISSTTDIDYWKFEYGTNPNGYQIALQVPSGGYNYGVSVFEKVNGQYQLFSNDPGDFYEDVYVTIPGPRSDGTIREFIIAIYSPYNIIFTPDKYYQLVIDPL